MKNASTVLKTGGTACDEGLGGNNASTECETVMCTASFKDLKMSGTSKMVDWMTMLLYCTTLNCENKEDVVATIST